MRPALHLGCLLPSEPVYLFVAAMSENTRVNVHVSGSLPMIWKGGSGWLHTLCKAMNDLELLNLLPLTPRDWDYRFVTPC